MVKNLFEPKADVIEIKSITEINFSAYKGKNIYVAFDVDCTLLGYSDRIMREENKIE